MTMTRRVLHVIPYLAAEAGGPPAVVERLVAHGAANGYDARVLSTAEMASGRGEAEGPDAGTTLLPTQRAAFYGSGKAQVNDALARADLLHLHTLWSPLVAQAALQARRLGVPYVLSPHGMLDPYSLGQKRLKKRLYLALIERRALDGAARLLFTADDERRLAAPIAGSSRAAVIALGADRPPAAPDILRTEFLAQHPDLQDRKRVIFLGRLHRKKRPRSALRAIAKIRECGDDVCLLIAGSGEAEPELRAMAREMDLGGNVRFLGFLAGRAKWQALAASDVFLLPSRQENFAIALAEALHAGVPALLTRQVNIWREVTDAGAGDLLDEDDLDESLAAGILAFVNHPPRQRAASEAARRLADQAFDWARSARETHRLYDRVLGE